MFHLCVCQKGLALFLAWCSHSRLSMLKRQNNRPFKLMFWKCTCNGPFFPKNSLISYLLLIFSHRHLFLYFFFLTCSYPHLSKLWPFKTHRDWIQTLIGQNMTSSRAEMTVWPRNYDPVLNTLLVINIPAFKCKLILNVYYELFCWILFKVHNWDCRHWLFLSNELIQI